MPRTRGARRSTRAGRGSLHGAPRRRSRVPRTPGAGASSLARATMSSTMTTLSPASLDVPSSPSAFQLPRNVAVSQFLDMICEENRQQLATQSGTTPSPPSPLSPTSTLVVPILPVAVSSTCSGMVLLLCMGACCRSVHGCVSAVCTGVSDRGITGVGDCGSMGAGDHGEHGCV